jgi:hypothetical protein
MPARSAPEWIQYFQEMLIDDRGTGDSASADASTRLQQCMLQQLECRLRCMQVSYPISQTSARTHIADVVSRLASAMDTEHITEFSPVAILAVETIITRILVLRCN